MIKICLVVAIMFASIMSSYVSVFASVNTPPVTKLQITGGLGEETTDLLVTFDTYRTITGIADENTVITIIVLNEIDDELIEIVEYKNTVGVSGIFSQDVHLNVADNVIIIKATKDNMEDEIITTIRRMGLDIKSEIEGQNIALPGRSII